MRPKRQAYFLSALLLVVLAPQGGEAQWSDEYDERVASPENFTGEFHVGAYQPNVGNDAFSTVFGGDKGPYIGGDLAYLVYRIPYIGPIGVGFSIGWAAYDADACASSGGVPDCSTRTNEETELIIYPITPQVSLRIDVLARELSVPLVFTPKIGLDIVPYRATTGSTTDASGASIGLRWAAQIALELDFINRRSARRLDEEWGINHSYLFFQPFGSTAQSQLPVGDNFAFTAGLGLVF